MGSLPRATSSPSRSGVKSQWRPRGNHKLPNSPNNQRRCHGPAEKDRVHGKRDGSAGAHDKRTNNKAHASANYREYRKRRKHATGNGGDPGRYGALHQRAKPSGDHGREDEPGTALQERQPAKRTRNRSRRNRKRVGLNGGYTDRRPNAHIEFTGGREGNQDRKQIERDVCQADEQGEHTPLLGADPTARDQPQRPAKDGRGTEVIHAGHHRGGQKLKRPARGTKGQKLCIGGAGPSARIVHIVQTGRILRRHPSRHRRRTGRRFGRAD